MCGPVVGRVGAECLEHFFNGVAFPRDSYLRMVFQVTLGVDTQECVQ
jgi:hypothetical protein